MKQLQLLTMISVAASMLLFLDICNGGARLDPLSTQTAALSTQPRLQKIMLRLGRWRMPGGWQAAVLI
jgi:hypothetical protein